MAWPVRCSRGRRPQSDAPGALAAIEPLEPRLLLSASSGVQQLVAQITTTDSHVPIYATGQVVGQGDTPALPQSSASQSLAEMDIFRTDPRFVGIDGSGSAVVIIDTGIDVDDPFFGPDTDGDGVADRIVYQYDFADGDNDATDVNGHGTNVSSIVASSDATYTGMAPGVDIISLKVFTDSGVGYLGIVEQALQWVVANAEEYNVVGVNISISDGNNWTSQGTHSGLGDELAAIAAMDIVTVAASGNYFGLYGSAAGVGYPAADPNSLSVGAVYDADIGGRSYSTGAVAYSTDVARIAPFSQRHSELTTVFAPGAPMTGAGAYSGLTTMQGTSQASAYVSGMVAVAQQLAQQTLGRRLTVDEFTTMLRDSSETINDGDDEDDNVTNTGLSFPLVNMFALGEAIWIAGLQAGDVNGDGTVDLQDFSLLKANFGTATGATWSQGDLNGDGAVDLQDFSLLKAAFGAAAEADASATQTSVESDEPVGEVVDILAAPKATVSSRVKGSVDGVGDNHVADQVWMDRFGAEHVRVVRFEQALEHLVRLDVESAELITQTLHDSQILRNQLKDSRPERSRRPVSADVERVDQQQLALGQGLPGAIEDILVSLVV